MTTVVITQPMLFPWPGFFEMLSLADVFIYLDDAQFSKGSFTNRVQIKLNDSIKWMTIPLVGKGSFQSILELQPTQENWKDSHRNLLRNALAGAPKLKEAVSLWDSVYSETQLCELLIQSIEAPASYLGIGKNRRIERTHSLDIESRSWKRVLDIVLQFGGTRYVTAHGAAQYLDHPAFEAEGVAVEYMDYSLTPWPQGAYPFTPYVSILNMIAYAGTDASKYLAPKTVPWREFLARRQANP